MRCPRILRFAFVATLVTACSPAAPPRAEAPKWEPAGQTKCGVTKSRSRPLIVEWPSPDRSALEAQARRGLIAVRYEGCSMEVLRSCRGTGKYAYAGVTRKQDHVAIRTADDLYASVPVHAAQLEGKLAQAGRLDVNMTVVGTYESDQHDVRRGDLTGDCASATHFVSAMTVGAFEFSAGGELEARGGASVLGAGVSAGTASSHEVLNRDGSPAACESAKSADSSPPEGCGALLRVEVEPIGEALREAQGYGGPVAPPPLTTHPVEPGPAPTYKPLPVFTWQPPAGPPPGTGSTQRAIGDTMSGIGILSLITGLSTGFVALILHSSLTDSCPGSVCPPEKQSSVDSYHTVATITTWTLIGGAAFLAGGITLRATAPRAAGLTVAPRIGLGFTGVAGAF